MSSRFSCITPGMDRFSLDLPKCALEVGRGCVLGLSVHRICNGKLI